MTLSIFRIRTYRPAAGLAMGLLGAALLAPGTSAGARDEKNAWGAAAIAAGIGAVIEANEDRPVNAAALAAGAVVAYGQYQRAQARERDERFSPYPVSRDGRYDDPYGYSRGRYDDRVPSSRPGSRDDGWNRRTDARYDRSTREVAGIVTGTTNAFSRKLKVRLDNGQTRTIDVPRDVRVRRSGDDISVHEVRRDDVVRIQIERYETSGDLRARRVDVISSYSDDRRWDDPYGYDRRDDRRDDRWDDRRDDRWDDRDLDAVRLTGRVSSIDSRENILRVDANGRRYIVYTDRAALRDRDGGIRLRDLQNGDRVTIEGRRDGDRIYATRVTLE